MWHHPAWQSSSWLVLYPKVILVMFSSPNNFLRDLVMVDWDFLCGKLLATKVVLILNSDWLPKSLSLVMLTLRRSDLNVRPLLRMTSRASSVVRVMKAKILLHAGLSEGEYLDFSTVIV